MIQRIQSIFLALCGFAMFSILFGTIWSEQDQAGNLSTLTATSITYTHDGQTESFQTFAIAIGAFISATLAFGSLFSYTSRTRQLLINLINTPIIGIVLGAMYYYSVQADDLFVGEGGQFKYWFFIPAISLIFNNIASKFIRSDEKLVRSADRLR